MTKFRFHEVFKDTMYIDSAIPIEETINYIQKNKIDSIIINYANGFEGDSIEALCELKEVKKIDILLMDNLDISCIRKMTHLEELSYNDEFDFDLDFSVFSKLKSISFDWNKKVKNLSTLKNLEHLGMSRYKDTNVLLSNFTKLKSLSLTQGNLNSLNFLENYKFLKRLNLAYLPRLADISCLNEVSKTLEELSITNCKKLEWHKFPELKSLKKLLIEGAILDDINFVKNLPKLEHLAIMGAKTDILNGDISPAINIKYVGIDNKKHYNYKYDYDLKKLIAR